MPQKIVADAVHDSDDARTNWNVMSDAELRDNALVQLSCLEDYRQQLTLRKQHLSAVQNEKRECEQRVASCEREISERLQRLGDRQKRLVYLRMLKEQTHVRTSAAAALAKDVEKLKEQQSDKECHLRDLVSQAELLTSQQQKLQHELNASVVSVGLLSADVNRLTEEISWTDTCNMEYEAQLNEKSEKLKRQQKHLDALHQNIMELKQQLENNNSSGNNAVGALQVRQNTSYRSLPRYAKLPSLTDQTVWPIDHRINAKYCKDTLSTEQFDVSTHEDKNFAGDSNAKSDELPVSMVTDTQNSCTFLSVASSNSSSQQMVANSGTNYSENLRNMSYRMIGRFTAQQGDTCQSKQSVASYLSVSFDSSTSVSSSDHRSCGISGVVPITVESPLESLPLTVKESQRLECPLQSNDVVHSSTQSEISELSSETSSPLNRSFPSAVRCGKPTLLPDIVGFLSDDVTVPNALTSCSSSTKTTSTVSPLSASSKVPPPVAQKPKFQHLCLSSYSVTSYDSATVSTQPSVLITTAHDTVDTVTDSSDTVSTSVPHNTSFSTRQDLSTGRRLNESALSKSDDLSQKLMDVQDLTSSSRLVDRLVYKPSVMHPVRRRRVSVEDGLEVPLTFLSSDIPGEDVSEQTAAVCCSEGNVSKVQTVKKKLQARMSRRVQFEPLALLLDAALEGEIDLLQTTLKVCDVSAANDEGITALHNAICAGHLSVAEYLVNYGCDVNAPDSDGWTPLHCAASCNNTDISQLLVQHGACILATTLSDNQRPVEKCEPGEDDYESCLHYLQDVEMRMREPGATAYAVFDYSAENTDELTFRVGDQLVVLQCNDDIETEWWWCQLGEHEGYVPQNLIALHPRNALSCTAERC